MDGAKSVLVKEAPNWLYLVNFVVWKMSLFLCSDMIMEWSFSKSVRVALSDVGVL